MASPLLLLSTLALHTKNVLADARCSLMLDERKGGDPLEGARVMLMGTLAATAEAAARAAYLRRHPEAEMFAGFADFAFYRMAVTRAHLVAGFGRIVDLKPADLLTEVSDAAALLAAEGEAIAHMNADHAEACRLYATKLLGATGRRRGAASASIRKASNCSRAARRCGCRFHSASPRRAPLRAVLKAAGGEGARGVKPGRRGRG